MSSPTRPLSPNLSIVTQRVCTPVGSEEEISSPRTPGSPARRVTSDALESASGLIPNSVGLSFIPSRSSSPQQIDTLEIRATEADLVVDSSSVDESISQERPNLLVTLSNRISVGVTDFINWVASLFYPSSVEGLRSEVSLSQCQDQEVSSVDAERALISTFFLTVSGRISNFITVIAERISSYFMAANTPVVSEREITQDIATAQAQAAMDLIHAANAAAAQAAADQEHAEAVLGAARTVLDELAIENEAIAFDERTARNLLQESIETAPAVSAVPAEVISEAHQ